MQLFLQRPLALIASKGGTLLITQVGLWA